MHAELAERTLRVLRAPSASSAFNWAAWPRQTFVPAFAGISGLGFASEAGSHG